MDRFASLLIAVVLGFSIFGSEPTCAAVIRVTAVGSVNSGRDEAGIFGVANEDLAGAAYMAFFNIDTSKGYVTGGIESSPQVGPRFYTSELHNLGKLPAVSATLSILEKTIAIAGTRIASNSYEADLHDGLSNLYQEAASESADLSFYDGYGLVLPEAPGSNEGVFHDPNLSPVNLRFDSLGYPYTLGSFAATNETATTALSLDLLKLDYTVISANGGPSYFVSAAPEPSDWGLMTAGIALIGGLLGYRRRTTQGPGRRFQTCLSGHGRPEPKGSLTTILGPDYVDLDHSRASLAPGKLQSV